MRKYVLTLRFISPTLTCQYFGVVIFSLECMGGNYCYCCCSSFSQQNKHVVVVVVVVVGDGGGGGGGGGDGGGGKYYCYIC